MDLFKTTEDCDSTVKLCYLVQRLENVLSNADQTDSQELYKDILSLSDIINSFLPEVKDFNEDILKDLTKNSSLYSEDEIDKIISSYFKDGEEYYLDREDLNKLIERLIFNYKNNSSRKVDKEDIDILVIRFAVRIARLSKKLGPTAEQYKEMHQRAKEKRIAHTIDIMLKKGLIPKKGINSLKN